MKRFFVFVVWGMLFLFSHALYGQTYRVYRPVPREIQTDEPKNNFLSSFSFSWWGLASSRKLVANNDAILSNFTVGYRLKGMYEVMESLRIGVEWGKQQSKDQKSAFLTDIKQEELAAVIQWIFTPQTQPQLYMTWVFGKAKNETRFAMGLKDLNHRTYYAAAGIGGKYEINKWLHIGAEYRIKYNFSPWETFVFKEETSLNNEISAGVFLEF